MLSRFESGQLSRIGIRHSQAGDTIVEVLLAIAIVSFVLVAAFATTNKNTQMNQDTQERGQALQLASSQVEFLHTKDLGSGNCFDADGSVQIAAAPPSASPCTVKNDGTTAQPSDQLAYKIAITTVGTATYKVSVTWDSVASSTPSSVTLYYQSGR